MNDYEEEDEEEFFIKNVTSFVKEITENSISTLIATLKEEFKQSHDEKILLKILSMKDFPVKELITEKQATDIVNENADLIDGGIVLNALILSEIMEQIQSVALGSALSKIAAKGDIECGWSNETSEMEFWLND